MNKNETEIDDPEVRDIFENKNFAFVATSMKDGSPHVTPTWIDIENGFLLVNRAIGRVKHKNVKNDPRIAISVADTNNPYHMVSVRGEVVEQITGERAENHIDKMAKKYIGKDKYPRRSSDEKRILFKIKPQKIFHMKQ